MLRFRALFPLRFRDRVLEALHERGAVQLREVSEAAVGRRPPSAELQALSSLLLRLREIQEVLGPPPRPVYVGPLSREEVARRAERLLSRLEGRWRALRSELEEVEGRKEELLKRKQLLEELRELDLPLSLLRPTEGVHVVVGRIPAQAVEGFLREVREAMGERVVAGERRKGGQEDRGGGLQGGGEAEALPPPLPVRGGAPGAPPPGGGSLGGPPEGGGGAGGAKGEGGGAGGEEEGAGREVGGGGGGHRGAAGDPGGEAEGGLPPGVHGEHGAAGGMGSRGGGA
jgi:hypothetical protein